MYRAPGQKIREKNKKSKPGLLRRAVPGGLGVMSFWDLAMAHGDVRVPADQLQRDLSAGFVWLDIFSVPQAFFSRERPLKKLDQIGKPY